MAGSPGLRVAVTGAAGFIGREVVERIQRGALDPLGPVVDLRLNDLHPLENAAAVVIQGSCADPDVRGRLVGEGIDLLFHLASLPGGAAQRDPVLGKRVNLDASIALMDAVSGDPAPVVVYASSIAVFGAAVDPVTEDTALSPGGSYGAHKAMIELYLADLTRRRRVDGRSVRPPGVVARPPGAYGGFATAWMSDLFHAAHQGRRTAVPVRPQARIWLQSLDATASNLIHAALAPAAGLSNQRVWTLPATVVVVEDLVAALARRAAPGFEVEFGTDLTDHPSLDARAASAMGFVGEADAEALVETVLTRIGRP